MNLHLYVCALQEPENTADWWGRPAESWSHEDALLAVGAAIVAELRAAVKLQLGCVRRCVQRQACCKPSCVVAAFCMPYCMPYVHVAPT